MGKILVWALALSVGAYAQNPNVFGNDDRQPVTSTQYPWRTVGYITGGCTATLVYRNLILTAAHCVFDENQNLKSFDFYPNMVNGNSQTKSSAVYTWWGTKDPIKNRGSDWAIVKLADNVGDVYGWMGATNDQYNQTTLVGYSGDYDNGMTATTHIGCEIKEKLSNFWLHDCDGNRGSSGGPMFSMNGDKPVIVSIQVAEYRDDGEVSLKVNSYERAHANIAVPTRAFLDKLKEAIAEQK